MSRSYLTTELKPTMIISVYTNDSEISYLELAKVEKGRVEGFRPFAESDIAAFTSLFKDKAAAYSYTYNPQVLSFKKSEAKFGLLFYTPPTQQMMIFTNGGPETAIRPVPGLIWNYSVKSQGYSTLDIWAYKEFKGFDTEVYRAPFYNVRDSYVCLGSAKMQINPLKSIDINKAISVVEQGFWKSAFSHVSGHNQTVDNITKVMNDLVGMNSFPESQLVPYILKENKLQTLRHVYDGDF